MDKDIIIDGQRLHYTDSFTGATGASKETWSDSTKAGGDSVPTIILMHGWGCSHSTLASIEKTALACGYRVINVDFPGFGDSPEPQTVWGVEDYTRLIEQLTSRLSIKSPSLLGHSFGGRVGILYASRNPVDRLILVDAAGIKPKRTLRYYWKVYTFKAMKRLMYLTMGREAAERKLDERRAKIGSSDYAAATPMNRRILSKVVNEDLTDRLPLIKAPTLLIWGENDTATPIADAHKMERAIPDAGLVAFPGCGHYSFLDNPVQFAAVLRSFLTEKG